MRGISFIWVEPSEERLERVVEEAIAGDVGAWRELWLLLAPMVERAVGKRRVAARWEDEEDARRDVAVLVFGKMREQRAVLLDLRAQLGRRDGSYRPWLAALVRNTAIDHVRRQADRLGPMEEGGRRWAMVVGVSDEPEGEAVDPLARIEIGRILEQADRHLSPLQAEALRRWAEGETAAEIAADLGLDDPAAAARLVRSAIAKLRWALAAAERNRRRGKKIV